MITTAQLTKSFIRGHSKSWSVKEENWLRQVFSAILKVSKKNREFIIDDVWEEISRREVKGTIDSLGVDTRVLGPMLRFMVSEGHLDPTGYYIRSSRQGSRPVMIWRSHLCELVGS
jgi:hypothetical protein